MLAHQHRRGSDDRDLPPRQRYGRGGAQRDFGLAEADISTYQPIHRLARGEIPQHGVDGRRLIRSLRIGEAGDETVIGLLGRLDRRQGGRRPSAGQFDQPLRGLADLQAHLFLAFEPGVAVQPIQLDRRPFPAIAP